jgi:hypothetical protein
MFLPVVHYRTDRLNTAQNKLGVHLARSVLDRVDDVLVARAAAKVAFDPCRISASDGFALRLNRSAAAMIMPGVQ